MVGGEKLGREEWKGERGKVNGRRGEGQQNSIHGLETHEDASVCGVFFHSEFSVLILNFCVRLSAPELRSAYIFTVSAETDFVVCLFCTVCIVMFEAYAIVVMPPPHRAEALSDAFV